MPVDVARIVHLTDLHLFVDDLGNPRSTYEEMPYRRLIRFFARLLGRSLAGIENGLNHHSDEALTALLDTLADLAGKSRREPLIIAQCGDVEAYGGRLGNSNIFDFPGFDFFDAQVKGLNVDAFVTIYGNHDLWPGTIPILRPTKIRRVLPELKSRAFFDSQIPDRVELNGNHCRIELYRIRTANSSSLLNTLAAGKIRDHLPKGMANYKQSLGRDPLAELDELCNVNSGKPVVRVLVMHHPPHFFAATGTLRDLTEGALTNADDFAKRQMNAVNPIHLIIAGHRHLPDPAPSVVLHPGRGGQAQLPLPAKVVQLVAESPTQDQGTEGKRPAFSVYRLEISDKKTLNVYRTIYRFESDLDLGFEPDSEFIVVDGLLL